MATDDKQDLLEGRVPAPDAEATPAERAHAKAFADLIDKTLAGRTPPAAMSADDRALLEVATVIRAVSGNGELAAEKRSSLVEAALLQAIGGKTPATEVLPVIASRALPGEAAAPKGAAGLIASRALPGEAAAPKDAAGSIASRALPGEAAAPKDAAGLISIARARRKRFAPWTVAGTSMAIAAAAIVLWLRAPRPIQTVEHPTAQLRENWKSRPTDSLIGPISRVHAGDASARIDTIFADRLDGYRELRLRGGHNP